MIRNKKKTGKFAAAVSVVLAAALLGMTVFASGTLAGMVQENGSVIINGQKYAMSPVYVENALAPHTDSYYLPLRETFEALGYQVVYDADKEKYSAYRDRKGFPAYEGIEHLEGVDEDGNAYSIDYNPDGWKKLLVSSEADYYIYGATQGVNGQLPLIEMTKDGKTEFCQIGSQKCSMGYLFAAPTLIDGKAYIPIRALAYLLGGQDNLKWNEAAHDTYYQGALTFRLDTLTVEMRTR